MLVPGKLKEAVPVSGGLGKTNSRPLQKRMENHNARSLLLQYWAYRERTYGFQILTTKISFWFYNNPRGRKCASVFICRWISEKVEKLIHTWLPGTREVKSLAQCPAVKVKFLSFLIGRVAKSSLNWIVLFHCKTFTSRIFSPLRECP